MGSCNSKNSSLASSATTADQYHRQKGGSSRHQTKNGSSSTNIADKAEKDSKRVSTCSFNDCGTIEYSFFLSACQRFLPSTTACAVRDCCLSRGTSTTAEGTSDVRCGFFELLHTPSCLCPGLSAALSSVCCISLFQRDRVDCRLDV